jgi:hypothetical protein
VESGNYAGLIGPQIGEDAAVIDAGADHALADASAMIANAQAEVCRLAEPSSVGRVSCAHAPPARRLERHRLELLFRNASVPGDPKCLLSTVGYIGYIG